MSYTPMQLAEAFIKAGELTDALEALNEQLADHPADAVARRLRAQVLLRMETSEALHGALQDLAAVEQTTEDELTVSVIHERLGDMQAAQWAAQNAYERANDDTLKARALERWLDLMRKNGQVEVALERALENDWVQWAADAAVDLNNDEKAIDYYTAALNRIDKLFDLTSDNIAANIRARVLLKRGGAYQRLGQWSQAQADYTAAQAIVPDDPMIAFNLGVIDVQQGDASAIQLICDVATTVPSALRQLMVADLQKNYPDLWTQVEDKLNDDT